MMYQPLFGHYKFQPKLHNKMSSLSRQQVLNLFSPHMAHNPLLQIMPGLIATIIVGGLAYYISTGVKGFLSSSPLFMGLIFGLLIGNTFTIPPSWWAGLNFVLKRLLRFSVILIGFQLTIGELFGFGIEGIIIAVIAVITTLLFGYILFIRWFKLEYTTSFLIIMGTAICGAVAIFATAPLLKAKHHQTVLAVTVITILGTIAMIVLPIMYNAGLFGPLNESTYGVLAGASLHEVVQVVGAGYNVSQDAGNAATIVKLSRVLLLIPVLLIVGSLIFHSKEKKSLARTFPWFIIGFIIAVIINSLAAPDETITQTIAQITTFLFVLVMAALGMQTHFRDVKQLSKKLLIAPVILFAFLFTISGALAYGFNSMGFGANMFYTSQIQTGYSVSLPDTRLGGEKLFHETGCVKCHTPFFEVDGKKIFVYSDLLLHDMGPDLDDKIIQGEAGGRDWRTAPLWGLHLRKQYLHDGRATTLRDAILAHGGEAEIVRNRFAELSEEEKQQLYAFLNSL